MKENKLRSGFMAIFGDDKNRKDCKTSNSPENKSNRYRSINSRGEMFRRVNT